MQSFCFAFFKSQLPSLSSFHNTLLFVIIDIFLFSGEYVAQFKFTLLLMPNGTSR